MTTREDLTPPFLPAAQGLGLRILVAVLVVRKGPFSYFFSDMFGYFSTFFSSYLHLQSLYCGCWKGNAFCLISSKQKIQYNTILGGIL